MKTYKETLDKTYQYFYDTNIKLWTVHQLDDNDNFIDEADYFQNKTEMLKQYKFKFKTL